MRRKAEGYGRNADLLLEKKEDAMIVVRGNAYGRAYDYKCILLSREGNKAVFETISEPKHRIEITPRYASPHIGSTDSIVNGKATTICAFMFDGEYAALAYFCEDGNGIEITPHEH